MYGYSAADGLAGTESFCSTAVLLPAPLKTLMRTVCSPAGSGLVRMRNGSNAESNIPSSGSALNHSPSPIWYCTPTIGAL